MGLGHVEVIDLDRDRIENRRDEAFALLPPTPFRHLNTDPQLRNGDRRDCDIVAIGDRLVQRTPATLGVDQDRRIEDQPCQGSATGSRPSRSSRTSSAQASSGK